MARLRKKIARSRSGLGWAPFLGQMDPVPGIGESVGTDAPTSNGLKAKCSQSGNGLGRYVLRAMTITFSPNRAGKTARASRHAIADGPTKIGNCTQRGNHLM